jgi:anti-sigma B factor antagonist
MKMEIQGDTVRISAVRELGEANANAFRDWVQGAMTAGQKNIDIDLSKTGFIDSSGLGALVALHKIATSRQGTVRLLSPQPPVRQILELTKMNHIFEIVEP